MKKNKGMYSLFIYYLIFFVHQGFFSFATKYMAEVGFDNTQIGLLTSIPFVIAMCFMPVFGALADRIPRKKLILIIGCVLSGAAFFFVDRFTNWTAFYAGEDIQTMFFPFMIVLTVTNIILLSLAPIATSIALEHTEKEKKSYGPIRMMGSIGFQIGSLLAGFILARSLRYLFNFEATALILASIAAFFLPNVAGHQNGKKKISPFVVLKDKRIVVLSLVILLATTTTNYSGSFLGVLMNEMKVSNRLNAILTVLGVLPEIPFLIFAHKLTKKCTVWQWLLISFVLNGLRWAGLFFAAKYNLHWLLFVCQIPAVATLACYEFIPQVYLNKIVPEELSSSAQTILNVVCFSLPRLTGSLLGGMISARIGTGNMFLACGIFLITAAIILAPFLLRFSKNDPACQPDA